MLRIILEVNNQLSKCQYYSWSGLRLNPLVLILKIVYFTSSGSQMREWSIGRMIIGRRKS
jgi:hypothetical protein